MCFFVPLDLSRTRTFSDARKITADDIKGLSYLKPMALFFTNMINSEVYAKETFQLFIVQLMSETRDWVSSRKECVATLLQSFHLHTPMRLSKENVRFTEGYSLSNNTIFPFQIFIHGRTQGTKFTVAIRVNWWIQNEHSQCNRKKLY